MNKKQSSVVCCDFGDCFVIVRRVSCWVRALYVLKRIHSMNSIDSNKRKMGRRDGTRISHLNTVDIIQSLFRAQISKYNLVMLARLLPRSILNLKL